VNDLEVHLRSSKLALYIIDYISLPVSGL